MTPLRFRAWDTSRNEWINFLPDPMHQIEGFTPTWYCNGQKIAEWVPYGKDVIVMQSTGLTDKNGKEIFEGDVLHFWGTYLGEKADRNIAVEWEEGQWNIAGIWGYSGETFFDIYECEVIGNVHENPDLLPTL